MISVILNGKTDISDFVTGVEWSGHSEKFNRQLNVSLANTRNGRTKAVAIAEGETVAFKWGNALLFVGIVFAIDTDISGGQSLTCYDSNVYLTKSNDIRKFTNKKASDIVRIIAKDFGIPVGKIADTGYVIPKLILRNKSLHEMILTALTVTRKQTGKRFFVGNVAGKLTLDTGADPKEKRYILKAGANITGASYARTIEDTKTQVKVSGGKKEKPTIAVVKNDALRKKYGVMQHVEDMDEKATASQVKQRAATLLKEMAVINDKASVESFGIQEVICGKGVYVIEPMTGLTGGYFVTSDSHTFEGRLHTMSLELSRTYDLPPIEIDKEVLGIVDKPKPKPKPKPKRRKRSGTVVKDDKKPVAKK
ncbi:tail protein [Sporosarcina phage Lietuvens]|nr:tail protein [Sporosarcina phage Lietuvens]